MSAPTPRPVGFIGLGHMGAPMAASLMRAGHAVLGFDLDPSALRAFADAPGAQVADSLERVGSDCDFVVTMLPTSRHVRDALLGPGGVASTLAPGSIVIDMSSSDPSDTVRLAAELRALRSTLVDAPVSGGPAGALAGSLAIMAGCDDAAAIERAMPVLQAMGSRITRTGGAGSGHAAKAINNVIAAAIITVTAEGLVLGQRFGLDPQTLLDVINSSTGRSGPSETLFPSQVLARKFSLGFALGLMAKDVGLAGGLARQLEADLPFVALTESVWTQARDALGAGADFTQIVRFVEGRNGLPR